MFSTRASLQHLVLGIHLEKERGDPGETKFLNGPESPFPGDHFEPVVGPADRGSLNDAVFRDRLFELVEPLPVEIDPGLLRFLFTLDTSTSNKLVHAGFDLPRRKSEGSTPPDASQSLIFHDG